jgi:hypothetical protein
MAATQAEKVAGARNLETVRVWITKAVRWTRERLNLRRWITGAALFCFLLAAVILLLAAAHGWVPPPTNEGQAARCYSDFQHAKLPMSLGCVMASHETLAGGLIAAAAALFGAWLAFSGLKEQIAISERNTRILQRAYISIEPLGIKPWHSPATRVPCNVVGHVECRNTGHLPARNFRLSRIRMKWVDDDRIEKEVPPNVDIVDQGGEQTIPIQARVPVGSESLSSEDLLQVVARKGYLLVWGKATYRDGFDTTPGRTIKFCHRYPCVDCIGDEKEGYTIGITNVRYHTHGNEQD